MTAQTDIYYTEKMKTARTESQFSQQPNELGIKVRSVLKSENRADRLLFYKINKKKDCSGFPVCKSKNPDVKMKVLMTPYIPRRSPAVRVMVWLGLESWSNRP